LCWVAWLNVSSSLSELTFPRDRSCWVFSIWKTIWKLLWIPTRNIFVGWYYNSLLHTTLKQIWNFFELFLKMEQQSTLNLIKYIGHTYFTNERSNRCILHLNSIFGIILRWSLIFVRIIAEFTTSAIYLQMSMLPIRNFPVTWYFVFYTHMHK